MKGAGRSRRQRTKTKHYTDDNPSTFTTKEKKGAAPPAPSPPPVKKRPRPRKSHCPTTPPPPTTCLKHHVRIAPLFQSTEPQHSVITGRGLGIPPPLKTPKWQQVPQPRFPRDKENIFEQGRKVSCTCLATDDNYLAMGDTAGFVSIYTLSPKLLCVTRLSTSASTRELETDQKLPPSKKFGLYQKKNHPNQVDKIALAGERVVVATKQELDLLDVKNNTILWSFALSITVHFLDIHPETHQVLCSFASDATHEGLWLMDTVIDGDKITGKKTLVRPKTDDSDELSLGHRCAAIWDKSNLEYLIMVTLVVQKDETVEQHLLQLPKSTFLIKQQTTVPNKPAGKSACHTIECLSQSPSGHLTLVSSTKGIQLLETSTFQILRVFGDAVALHGHSLLFQHCCFVPKPTLDREVEDLLEARENQQNKKSKHWESQNDAWIMGVPFANRQPIEFRDMLHMWDLWEGKCTSTTLLAPPKADGFISVQYVQNQLIATTQTGHCYHMAPTLQSDFGGIMYPPGYQVINDNLEYIEDEDDVDVIVSAEALLEGDDGDVDMEDEVAEALRVSMAEQQKMTTAPPDDEIIDVVSGGEPKPAYLPCHPEPFLKQELECGGSPMSTGGSHEYVATSASFASALLLPMPYIQDAIEAKQANPLSDEPKIQPKLIRAKRSKAASLEALLKSSLDPDLRRIMMSRQVWGDGSGSHFGTVCWADKSTRADEKTAKEGSNGSEDAGVEEQGLPPPPEIVPPVVSPSEGSVKNGSTNGDSATNGNSVAVPTNDDEIAMEDDSEKVKMDVATALPVTNDDSVSVPTNDDEIAVKDGSERVKIDVVSALLMPASNDDSAAVPTNDDEIAMEDDSESVKMDAVSALPMSDTNGDSAAVSVPTNDDAMGDDSERVKMDVVAALLMSASGELDSPVPAEKPETKTAGECMACRGRWVYHSCSKKDKPVDYEELVKADEEKKEQEEEEKRKARAEKRRLADAKRREARKKKKMEEDTRNRRAEVERMRWENDHRQQELERTRLHSEDKDRRRADMLLRLQAEQERSSSNWRPPVQSFAEEPPESERTYQQAYSTPQSDWPPPPVQSYETSREAPRQMPSYSVDWPPLAAPSDHVPQHETSAASAAPYVAEWPQPVRTHEQETVTSDSHYRGAQHQWSAAPETHAQKETTSEQTATAYTTASVPSASTPAQNNDSSEHAAQSYSSSYYSSTPVAAAAASEIAAPPSSESTTTQADDTSGGQAYSSNYYNSTTTTPKAATSEFLDPAEALASLAMFATAAPMVSEQTDYEAESSYNGIGQYHQRHQPGSYEQEQQPRQEQQYKSNGWGNNSNPPPPDQTQQGTSNN